MTKNQLTHRQVSLQFLLKLITAVSAVLAAFGYLQRVGEINYLAVATEFTGLTYSLLFVWILSLAVSRAGSAFEKRGRLAGYFVLTLFYAVFPPLLMLFNEISDQMFNVLPWNIDLRRGTPNAEYTYKLTVILVMLLTESWLILTAMWLDFRFHTDYLLEISRDDAKSIVESDLRYYPRPLTAFRALVHPWVRVVCISGMLTIFACYTYSILYRHRGFFEMPFCSFRHFLICHYLWGLFWFVDACTRPHLRTLLAAILFLLLCLLLSVVYPFHLL